jgi:hypothetical protein
VGSGITTDCTLRPVVGATDELELVETQAEVEVGPGGEGVSALLTRRVYWL